ncbi:MAG: hypothetical protein ACRC0V_04005 [Fusobacteriaceae bacterium]
MKKLLFMIFLVLSNYIFALEVVGNIYNFEQSGTSYKGRVDANIFSYKKNFNIKFIPEKNIEILRVNGAKNENNVYEIKDGNLNIEFMYKSKLKSIEEKLIIGRIEYLDEVGKTELLLGDIAVEFRKIGKIDVKVKGAMDFGLIPSRVPKNGISSKRNPEIAVKLNIDKKDVGNTKLYFQYPEELKMADGQLIVKLNNRNKVDFKSEKIENGEKINILGYFPKTDNLNEKIILEGKVYSIVNNVKPGEYKETVTVKAYYEYLDYSIEKKGHNRKVVIRR